MDPETKKLLEQLNQTFAEFKTRHEQEITEAKKIGEGTAETKTAIERVQNQLDEIEKKMQRAAIAGGSGDETKAAETKAAALELKAFDNYLRKGEQKLSVEEVKALSTDSDTDGGFLVPATRSNRLIELLREVSALRGLCTVETISQGNAFEYPIEGAEGIDSGWVGEREARDETSTPKVGLGKIPVHEIYANPHATRTMLDDSGFDVDGWFNRRVTNAFDKKEGVAFLSGDGVGKPFGMLLSNLITDVETSTVGAIKADDLIDLVYDLPETYAKNGVILLRRSSIRTIRKLKDSQGNYLWAPGLAGGQPATILDRPYREVVDMPEIANGALPIMFGDFKAGYTIVDRQGHRTIRDEVTRKPFVQFYTTKRVGGQVVLGEALRRLKVKAA